MNGTARWPNVQSLLKLTENTYMNFKNTDQWAAVGNKTSQSTFPAAERNNDKGNNKRELIDGKPLSLLQKVQKWVPARNSTLLP